MTAPTFIPLDNNTGQSRVRQWLAGRWEGIAFWALAAAYLVPVWSFHFVPTQDGPSHLANAQILKDYGKSPAGYEKIFQVRAEPLPNWTSHVLLAAELYLFPPFVAEKLLVSLYILGFAGAFRYFLGAFGDRCRPLSWTGLLFVYNRCFWMGFYNYCLSLVLLWVILGYLLRRRGALHLPQTFVLMVLFALAYFTHLVGFLLAFGSALGAAIMVRPRRLLRLVVVCLAAAPAACLVMDYFDRTGFFDSEASRLITEHPFAVLRGNDVTGQLFEQLDVIDRELFEYHAGSNIPFSLYLVPYFVLLALCTVAGGLRGAEAKVAGPGWLFPFLLGLVLMGIYLLLPQHLTSENGVLNHGGFIKTRLALLPPLLWLACLREPAWAGLRIPIRVVSVALLSANLLLVMSTFRSGNQELAKYTAGMEAVGRGHRLFIVQEDHRASPLVDPVLHAADYYCQGTDNVNLDNYEATTPHFPVKYRPGVARAEGYWDGYTNQSAVDTFISWYARPSDHPAGWIEIYSDGPLRIYRRPKK